MATFIDGHESVWYFLNTYEVLMEYLKLCSSIRTFNSWEATLVMAATPSVYRTSRSISGRNTFGFSRICDKQFWEPSCS